MRGVSYRGDIGLDDISFTDGPCCKLQMSIDLSRSESVHAPALKLRTRNLACLFFPAMVLKSSNSVTKLCLRLPSTLIRLSVFG